MNPIAEIVLLAVTTYVGVGAIFAVFFVTVGVSRFDPDAARPTVGFRTLILPGTITLWPLLLARWPSAGKTGEGAGQS